MFTLSDTFTSLPPLYSDHTGKYEDYLSNVTAKELESWGNPIKILSYFENFLKKYKFTIHNNVKLTRVSLKEDIVLIGSRVKAPT